MSIYKDIKGNPAEGASVVKIGESLGLTPEQSHVVARQLSKLGYIRLLGTVDPMQEEAQMTEKFLEYAESLMTPWWGKILKSSFLHGVLGGAAVFVVTQILKLLF